MAFLNLNKAFDTLDHRILNKLYHYGFRGVGIAFMVRKLFIQQIPAGLYP